MHHLKHYFENGVLLSEAEAWQFALERFEGRAEEIEDATSSFMWDRCLGSYYRGAVLSRGRSDCTLPNGNRHHVKFAYDEPGDLFNMVRTTITEGVMLEI